MSDAQLRLGTRVVGQGGESQSLERWLGEVRRHRRLLSDRIRLTTDDVDVTGQVDAAPKVAAACAEVAASGGGHVILPRSGRVLIDTDLVVAEAAHLEGPLDYAGLPGTGADADIFALQGRLIVAPGARIRLKGSASVTGAFILRKGMTSYANDASAYAGTVFVVEGEDTVVDELLVVGFGAVWSSYGYGRHTATNVKFDATGGFECAESLDISRWRDLHKWPFGTIRAARPNHAFGPHHFLFRTGTAFRSRKRNDWADWSGLFTYGSMIGFDIEDGQNMTIMAVGADNISTAPANGGSHATQSVPGTRGLRIGGGADMLTCVNPKMAAQELAYEIDTGSAGPAGLVRLIGADAWGVKHGIRVLSGNVYAPGLKLRGAHLSHPGLGGTGADVSAVAVLRADDAVISEFQTAVDAQGGPGFRSRGGLTIRDGPVVRTGLASLASADPFPIPTDATTLRVTGTVSFGNAHPTFAGHTVRLVFSDVLSIYSGASFRLAGTYTSNRHSTLTIVCDGTRWLEDRRSTNDPTG